MQFWIVIILKGWACQIIESSKFKGINAIKVFKVPYFFCFLFIVYICQSKANSCDAGRESSGRKNAVSTDIFKIKIGYNIGC